MSSSCIEITYKIWDEDTSLTDPLVVQPNPDFPELTEISQGSGVISVSRDNLPNLIKVLQERLKAANSA